MARITDYDEKTNPNGETDYFVIAYGGQNYKVKMSNGAFWAERYKKKTIISDLVEGSEAQLSPFGLFNPGVTIAQVASENDHPGIWQISDSAAGLGGGFDINDDHSFLGGETVEAIFRIQNNDGRVAIGLFDFSNLNNFGAGADEGAWIMCINTTLTGRTKRVPGLSSTTPSSYELSTNTWYRAKMAVSDDAASVNFYLYSADTDALLWQDSLASTMPVSCGQFVLLAARGGGVAVDVDWIAYYNQTELTR